MLILLVCVLLALLFLLLRMQNLPREIRGRQVLIPLVSLVYAACIGSLILPLGTAVRDFLINVIPVQWYNQVGIDLALMLISNVSALLGFIVIKTIYRRILAKKIGDRLYDGITRRIIDRYYNHPTSDAYTAKPHSGLVAWYLSFVFISLCSCFALYAIIFAFFPSLLRITVPWDYLMFWPVTVIIICFESLWFLDGVKFDSNNDKRSTEETAEERKLYEIDFPEWLAAKERKKTRYSENVTMDFTVSQLAQMVSASMKCVGIDCDDKVAYCISRISEKKDILIDGILMSPLGIAVLHYMDLLLARGENLLVLCADDALAEEYTGLIKEQLDKAHYSSAIWIVRGPSEAQKSGDCDVLVLTPEEVLSMKTGMTKNTFSERLKNLLILDTAEILAQQSDLFTTAIRLLKSNCENLSIVFLSGGIPLQLSSSLERILGYPSGLLSVAYTESNAQDLTVYLWNTDNNISMQIPQEKLVKKQLDNTNFGLPFSLAIDVFREEELPLYIHSSTMPLYQTIRSANNAPALRQLLGGEKGQGLFFRELSVNRENSKTVIWEDSTCNLPNALRNAFAYASDNACVHIVSKSYMLRAFFVDRFCDESFNLVSERSYFNALTSSFSDTEYTASVNILIEAASPAGIEQTRLLRLASGFLSQEHCNIGEALSWCRSNILESDVQYPLENDFFIEEAPVFINDNFERHHFVHLANRKLLTNLLSGNLKRATLQIESLTDTTKRMLWFGADSIHQRYMVNQGFQYNNVLYTIREINDEDGVIRVIQAEESLKTAHDYMQTRIYEPRGEMVGSTLISGMNNVGTSMAMLRVQECVCMEMAVHTTGYFAIPYDVPSPILFRTNRNTPYFAIGQSNEPRILKSPHFILLSIYHPDGSNERVACLLAVLFNELFKTFFPYDWQCISACPLISPDCLTNDEFNQDWGILSKYYPSTLLAAEEDKTGHYAQIAIFEDNIHATGRYLDALLGDPQRPFEKALSVIHDYLHWVSANPMRQEYLYYGKGTLPACFDMDAMIRTLDSLSGYVIR